MKNMNKLQDICNRIRQRYIIERLCVHHTAILPIKGRSFLDAGYVYAPYVPLIVTSTIFKKEDMEFKFRKGIMPRYGKSMVKKDFYGTVNVLDLNVI